MKTTEDYFNKNNFVTDLHFYPAEEVKQHTNMILDYEHWRVISVMNRTRVTIIVQIRALMGGDYYDKHYYCLCFNGCERYFETLGELNEYAKPFFRKHFYLQWDKIFPFAGYDHLIIEPCR